MQRQKNLLFSLMFAGGRVLGARAWGGAGKICADYHWGRGEQFGRDFGGDAIFA
jgi:hypothetical protein